MKDSSYEGFRTKKKGRKKSILAVHVDTLLKQIEKIVPSLMPQSAVQMYNHHTNISLYLSCRCYQT